MSERLKLSSETSAEGDDDGSSEGKPSKKKYGAVKLLGGLTAENIVRNRQKEADRQVSWADKRFELLDRKGDEKNQSKEQGIEPKDQKAAADPSLPKADISQGTGDETIPLTELTEGEKRDTIKDYSAARTVGLEQELHSQEASTPEAAGTAAGIAYHNTAREQLAAESDRPPSEALKTAEQLVMERIAAYGPKEAAEHTATDGQEPHTPAEDASEESDAEPGAPDAEPEETAVSPELSTEAAENDPEETDDDPAAAAGGVASPPNPPSSGGGNSGGNSGAGGPGNSGMPPAGGPPGPGGGGPNRPIIPYAAYAVPPTPPTHIGAPPLPAAVTGMVPSGIAHNRERQAAARGLIVGGIIGYLIGRRRGRIKTERKLKPIQQKLERQVNDLQESVYRGEQHVRAQAAETASLMYQSREREKFTQQLLQKEALRRNAAQRESARRDALQNERLSGNGRLAGNERLTSSRTAAESATEKSAPAFISTERPVRQSEQLGRLLVESPLAPVALAGVTASSIKEKAPAFPNGRRAEALGHKELERAAENIKIEGVTLKELHDNRRLDERGLRRVMEEYLKGGNVKETLARELLEKELSFERDPFLRNAQTGTLTGGGAHTAAAAAAVAMQAASLDEAGSAEQSAPGSRPTPDAATLKALRNKQTAAAGGGVLVIVIILLVLFFMAR